MKSNYAAPIQTGQGMGCFLFFVIFGVLTGLLLFGCGERKETLDEAYSNEIKYIKASEVASQKFNEAADNFQRCVAAVKIDSAEYYFIREAAFHEIQNAIK